MPPPELARNAPGFDVFEPVKIDLLVLLGQNRHVAVFNRVDRRLDDFRRVHVPLIGQERLDRNARAVAMRHIVPVRVDAVEPVFGARGLHDPVAGLVTVSTIQRLDHPGQPVCIAALYEIGVVFQSHSGGC